MLFATTFVFTGAACGSGGTGSDGDEKPAVDDKTENIKLHMSEHFVQITTIRDAVIKGDLEAVNKATKEFRDHPTYKDLPEDWEPYMSSLRGAADIAVTADRISLAASALSSMAYVCGACHKQNDVRVKFAAVALPEPGDDPKKHMLQHQWAADRMWEGLVSPSSELWKSGAEQLAGSALQPADMGGLGRNLKQIRLLGEQTHKMALEARDAEDLQRSRIYGMFVGACAGCHRLIESGPKEPQRIKPVDGPE